MEAVVVSQYCLFFEGVRFRLLEANGNHPHCVFLPILRQAKNFGLTSLKDHSQFVTPLRKKRTWLFGQVSKWSANWSIAEAATVVLVFLFLRLLVREKPSLADHNLIVFRENSRFEQPLKMYHRGARKRLHAQQREHDKPKAFECIGCPRLSYGCGLKIGIVV